MRARRWAAACLAVASACAQSSGRPPDPAPDARVAETAPRKDAAGSVDARAAAPSDVVAPPDVGVSPPAKADAAPTAADVAPAVTLNPLDGVSAPQRVDIGTTAFCEGAVWIAAREVLILSVAEAIVEWSPTTRQLNTLREAGARTNGNTLDFSRPGSPDGQLVSCEQRRDRRRISRTTSLAGGEAETVADRFEGKPFNSPNDIAARRDGNIYFSDPQHGGNGTELGFNGVFRVAPDGKVSVVDRTLEAPNGVAVSPDGGTLYVSDSGAGGKIYKYALAADGAAGPRAAFADAPSSPDGIGVDDAGNLYVAQYGTKLVRALRPDGTSWGTLAVPESATNVSFGGADRRTLFITTARGLFQTRTNVPGRP